VIVFVKKIKANKEDVLVENVKKNIIVKREKNVVKKNIYVAMKNP
jgi:hypothetical protein